MAYTTRGRGVLALAAVVCCAASAAVGPAASGAGAAWAVRRLPTAPSFAEPGIAAGRAGQLLINACTANAGEPASFWRSRDGGRSWSAPFTIGTSAIGCGDADTAIGPDGAAYAVVLGTGVSVYRSRDGRRWSGPATFPPPHGEDQPDRPWLVTVPSRPRLVYVFNSEVGGDIVQWTSTDGGATFSGPRPVTGGINSQAALAIGSRPLVAPTNPRHLDMFYETAGFDALASAVAGDVPAQFPFTQLWQASTTDGGTSWSNHLVVDAASFAGAGATLGHLLPATAIDATGTVYAVLSVQRAGNEATHLYLLHSMSGGGWSAPVRVDREGASNVYPAVAVSSPGHACISWYGSAAGSFDDRTARWHEYVGTSDDALSAHPHMTSQSIGPVVHVGPIEQAGAVGSDLGQNWDLRDFQSATVDDRGRPHVTWAVDSSGAGRVLTATSGSRC